MTITEKYREQNVAFCFIYTTYLYYNTKLKRHEMHKVTERGFYNSVQEIRNAYYEDR